MKRIVMNIQCSLKIIISASMTYFVLRMIIKIILLCSPFIVTFLIRQLTNILIEGEFDKAYTYILLIATAQLISMFLGKLNVNITTLHNDLISQKTSEEIIDIVSKLDISCFDNTDFYNELTNVTRDIMSVGDFLWTIVSIIESFFKFCISLWLLRNLGAGYVFLIVIFSIPTLVHDRQYSLKLYDFSRETVNEVRKRNYFFDILTSKYFSKDIRINKLQEKMKKKFLLYWENWFKKKNDIHKKYLKISIPLSTLPLASTTIAMIRIVKKIMDRKMMIGDLSYGLGMINQLVASIQSFVSDVCVIAEKMVIVDNYINFKNWEKKKCNKSSCSVISNKNTFTSFEEIKFVDVFFKYPNTDFYILKGVTFSIKKGEIIGIVGKNGCGKTTVIKLLMKLYRPTKGKIYLNGVDIESIPDEEYMKYFSVMFQDYINYCFSYKENLHTVNINEKINEYKILDATYKSGVIDFIDLWENGTNTYLTKSYDLQGVEMSGGQWQKVALARLFYKNAPILLLDEPSASLDVESEHQIFKSLYGMHGKKTSLIITHRLKNVSFADKIIVINEGIVVEIGKHNQLLEKGGIYKKMYDYENLCV